MTEDHAGIGGRALGSLWPSLRLLDRPAWGARDACHMPHVSCCTGCGPVSRWSDNTRHKHRLSMPRDMFDSYISRQSVKDYAVNTVYPPKAHKTYQLSDVGRLGGSRLETSSPMAKPLTPTPWLHLTLFAAYYPPSSSLHALVLRPAVSCFHVSSRTAGH
jgi:hypothetical protein